ncbi:MAG: hypothetical protein K5984_02865 [Bacteroidales bacterium]|nr:hypothetical protein [Bacteroidales bacterium]
MKTTRKIYILAVMAAGILAFSSCGKEESDEPTIKVPDEQAAGSQVDAPGVRIIDVKTNGFTANWKKVTDALNYEYSLDGGEVLTTTDTNIVFTGLETETEHVFEILANPRTESGRLQSNSVSVTVVTSEIAALDMPDVVLGTVSTNITVASWGVVPEAAGYEWTLGDETGTTEKTYITFAGLIADREYTLKVRSLTSDETSRTNSEWTEVTFTPTNDGSEKMYFSNFTATSDGISFNVYANSGQYYWYDIIPMIEYGKYTSEEEYITAVKENITTKVNALISSGKDSETAYASVLKSGSANIVEGVYQSLSYSVALFQMDLAGNIVGDVTRVEIKTPSDLDTDGPEYASEGDWFEQTMMLGVNTSYPPTTYVAFRRTGTGVVAINYSLYTTSNFYKQFGTNLDEEALGKIKDAIISGSTASDSQLEKVNGTGYNAGYTNRTPGTSYTLAALATNTAGEQILAINSVTTRTTTAENNWITYALKSTTASSYIIRMNLADGIDIVSGKFFNGNYDDVYNTYSRAQYRDLFLTQGTDLTDAQIQELNANGYIDITVSGLDSGTGYIAGFAATNSTGDTTTKNSGKITTK